MDVSLKPHNPKDPKGQVCGLNFEKKDENGAPLNLGLKNESKDALVYVNFCEVYQPKSIVKSQKYNSNSTGIYSICRKPHAICANRPN